MNGKLSIAERVALAPHTTLQVGGDARYFTTCRSLEELSQALEFARERGVDPFVLGGGSNLCVADRGLNALVIALDLRGFDITPTAQGAWMDVAAGEVWDSVVLRAVQAGLSGIECLSGIPGKTGATPIQNVGAYGQEVSDTIRTVSVVDRHSREHRELDAAELEFGYRDSAFKRHWRGRFVVTRVRFELSNAPPRVKPYAELSRAMQGRPSDVATLRDTVLELRRAKSMVRSLDDPNHRNVGSFFMNPIVSKEQRDALVADCAREEKTPPSHETPGGAYKLAAAWLIENAGFAKGMQRGAAGISSKHTLCLINRGGASAADIVGLAQEIQAGVLARFGIRLMPEPELLGFAVDELGLLGPEQPT